MNTGRKFVLLLALLTQSFVLSSPLNACPAFEAQGVTITQIPMNTNFDFSITTTVPLISAQPDISFKIAISYMCLSMPSVEDSVQIHIWVDSYNATQFKVATQAPSSGISMQSLKIVYLIMPSAYNNDIYIFTPNNCIMASCGFDYVLSPGATLSMVQSYPVTLTTGNYQAVGFTNALNIKSTNYPSGTIGIALNVSIINATHYSLNFTSLSSEPIKLQGYYVTVLVFRSPSTLYGLKITILTLSVTGSISDDSISPARTFFGIAQYSFRNADFQFCIGITNRTAQKNINLNMISLKVQLISFEVGACCLSTPLIDASNSSCTSSCPDRFYADNSSLSCQPCFYDCYACNSSSSCNSCNITTDFRQYNPTTLRCDPIVGYFETGSTIALPCNYPKCCGYTPIINNENSSCVLACPAGFVENPATKVCIACVPGYMPASGHCTNIIGCVSTTIRNNTVECIFCSSSDHLILQNQACVCLQGYNQDITGKCMEVCGDGIHFSQKCDDNNTVDGDGCSSTCQTEDYFLCNSSSNYVPSECSYVGNMLLTFNYARKTQGKNQGVFSFSLTAKHASLDTANIISSFDFNCDPLITSIAMQIVSTEVLLFVDYQEDLEGKVSVVRFNLNPKKVLLSTSLTIMPLMASRNQKLVVLHGYPMIASLKKGIEVLALVALAVFGLASLAYRMIAVEMMHSFLLVYMFCIETSSPTEPFLVFKNLRILALNFDASGNYYSQSSSLSYSFQNELTTKKTLGFLLFASLAVLVVEKIVRECIKDSTGKLTTRSFKILRICRRALKSLLFSLSIGFGYQVMMHSFMSFSFNNINQQMQAASLVLFLGVCFSLLFFGEFTPTVRTKDKANEGSSQHRSLHKTQYICVYLFFWLDIMIFLVLNSYNKSDCLEEDCLAVIVLFFLWFLCVRPYEACIHNIGQLVNIMIELLFISWSVARKYVQLLRSEDMQIYISTGIIGLMTLSLILSIFRVINVICLNCRKSPKSAQRAANQTENPKVNCERIEDALEAQNRYRIKSILLSEQLLEINSSLRPGVNSKWKKELLATLKEKYKIKNHQKDNESEDADHAVPQLGGRQY